MLRSWFHMHRHCPACNTPFERASGEITGGMGVNIVATLLLVILVAALIGFSSLPLLPAMLGLAVLTIAFPIGFYPFSRALWAALLFLTGDNRETD
ncbi:MAG TPA: DUF983 domain-containing protein [Roseiflexaceae bacterium]|nr:DUF983 domain-containing protein [Roseiflexaceae bacterium]